jgi:hypothetical protein
MTVINTKDDVSLCLPDDVCNLCRGELVPPFFEWMCRGGPNLHICGRCCHTNKRGIIADLIQLAATVELRSLSYGSGAFVRG